MDEQLKTILKYLRLGDVRTQWDELLAEAEQEHFSHERLLKHLFETVCAPSSTGAEKATADEVRRTPSMRRRRSDTAVGGRVAPPRCGA